MHVGVNNPARLRKVSVTGPVHVVPTTLPCTGGSLQPVKVFVGAVVGRNIPIVHAADEVWGEQGQLSIPSLACPVHQPYLLTREHSPSREPPRRHLTGTTRQSGIRIKPLHIAVVTKGVRWQTVFRFSPDQAKPAHVVSPQCALQSSITSVAITTAVEDPTLG